MKKQIKFFMAEELHNYMEDQAVSVLGNKIENDKLFTFDDMAFFYKIENEKEIVSKYPELTEVIEEESMELETFIEWQCNSGESFEVANGLISINEYAILDGIKEMTETEEFEKEFMNSPLETVKKLRKETIDFLVATKIGEIVQLATKEGFNIDMGHVNIVAKI